MRFGFYGIFLIKRKRYRVYIVTSIIGLFLTFVAISFFTPIALNQCPEMMP